ncbi:MAG TPA: hypothetical protein VGO06_27845 [Bosea sp. (in: a-proteobacteria)]|jgi:hypothetical protein|uniref:DUF7696 family protein n=1 Tax=Bosea sp. (in: a-proteobacteria) TaxID=1871050 RepID=UPI002E1232F4|nr:hypothetical protein [Bosea sp. (in: a-proteobacteria)]
MMMAHNHTDRPMAYSHLAGAEVRTWSEEWRHECEIAYLAGLAPPKLSVMLDGVAASTDREERGVKGVRGEAAVVKLRAEIERFGQLSSNRFTRRSLPPSTIEPVPPSDSMLYGQRWRASKSVTPSARTAALDASYAEAPECLGQSIRREFP